MKGEVLISEDTSMDYDSASTKDRILIGFFGMRNAGKSSVVNAFAGQEIALVSDEKGTTTEPIFQDLDIFPLGPVTIIDTPGMDVEGELGVERFEKCKEVMDLVDVIVHVVDGTIGLSDGDRVLIQMFRERHIPYITVYNKLDLVSRQIGEDMVKEPVEGTIWVSAADQININDLKQMVRVAISLKAM